MFPLPAHTVRRLTPADAGALQDLLVRCSDYYELHEGRPTPAHAAEECFVGRPPGEKVILGISDADGTLVAMVDLLMHYPKPDEAWIGLLVVDPRERSRGLGAAVVDATVRWMAAEGCPNVYIGTSESNPRAQQFWRGHGFEEKWRQEYPYEHGHVDRIVVMMRSAAAGRVLDS